MTTTTPSSLPIRRSSRRLVAGVCGGLADYSGLDVNLLRVLAVVLTVLGGVGVPLYLAIWLLVPADGHDRSIAERYLQR
jgi:phage shock protein PspC (stress-responsive transcriptional regulator)